MNMILSLIFFTATFAAWIYITLSLKKDSKESNFALRGVWKLHTLELIEFNNPRIMNTWLIITIVWSLSAWIFVSSVLWHSDYNFLIGLFPFLWYYFALRYFIWEKDDVIDQPVRKK